MPLVFALFLADVIAKMADDVAMFRIIGRCYCHVAGVVATVLFCLFLTDVIALWLMLLPPL